MKSLAVAFGSWSTRDRSLRALILRGGDDRTGALPSYVDLEMRVRQGHPPASERLLLNVALSEMEGGVLDASLVAWSPLDRAGEAAEDGAAAGAFFSIRSGRQLMERLVATLSVQLASKNLNAVACHGGAAIDARE